MRRVLVASLAALAVLASPGAVPASHGIADAECTGETFADSEVTWFGECYTEFDLPAGAEISQLETHANFHDTAPAVSGRMVSLYWNDAVGHTVGIVECRTTGAAVEGIGPFDVQSATCTAEIKPSYEPGRQTLSVIGTSSVDTSGIPFHGRLVFTSV